MQLYFATSNKNKIAEARAILGIGIKQVHLDIPEIQSISALEVAEDKARKAYSALKKPVIVEDTALHINAWNGFPGAMIKFMLKGMGNDGICSALTMFKDKRAYAETCVAYFDGSEMRSFLGKAQGAISSSPKGPDSFGWDIIFIPKGYTITFAEMGKDKKNAISHRYKAFMKLKIHLKRS